VELAATQKYQFVAAHTSQYLVVVICRVLGLARSGSDAWHARTPSARQQQDAQLTDQITRIFTASRRHHHPGLRADTQALAHDS
jgi:hypothetical protein